MLKADLQILRAKSLKSEIDIIIANSQKLRKKSENCRKKSDQIIANSQKLRKGLELKSIQPSTVKNCNLSFDGGIEETIDNTIKQTIDNTIEETTDNAIKETIDNTINETIDNTIKEIIDNTIKETIDNTITETIDNTIVKAIDDTEETIDDSEETAYINMLNKMIDNVNDFKSAEFTYASCSDKINEIMIEIKEDNICDDEIYEL